MLSRGEGDACERHLERVTTRLDRSQSWVLRQAIARGVSG
ncbi:hypothetical protein A7982_13960 [Minicystis rosea]|nr:hypothetical protein A7982_13960 [Minicystis rosea]